MDRPELYMYLGEYIQMESATFTRPTAEGFVVYMWTIREVVIDPVTAYQMFGKEE